VVLLVSGRNIPAYANHVSRLVSYAARTPCRATEASK